MFRMEAMDCICPRLTTQQAGQFLSRAWEQVSTEGPDHTWKSYEPDDDDE
jgi:hypothetical protein